MNGYLENSPESRTGLLKMSSILRKHNQILSKGRVMVAFTVSALFKLLP